MLVRPVTHPFPRRLRLSPASSWSPLSRRVRYGEHDNVARDNGVTPGGFDSIPQLSVDSAGINHRWSDRRSVVEVRDGGAGRAVVQTLRVTDQESAGVVDP